MPKINSRAKGSQGEREWCAFLLKHFDIEAERNLDQVRDGGCDIITDHYVFEVKRVENLDIQNAWIQAKTASLAFNGEKTPIVAFRRNREKWNCAISSFNIGMKYGYIILPEKVFINWFKNELLMWNLDVDKYNKFGNVTTISKTQKIV